MIQTTERLELPADTYHALEQIAAFQGVTLAAMIEQWIQQHRTRENLVSLRQEYQRLTDKALTQTITRAEEKRMDALCAEINAANQQSNPAHALEQTNWRADELIAKSEQLLARAEA